MEYSIEFYLNDGLHVTHSLKPQWGDTFIFQTNTTLQQRSLMLYAKTQARKLKLWKITRVFVQPKAALGTMLYFVIVQKIENPD